MFLVRKVQSFSGLLPITNTEARECGAQLGYREILEINTEDAFKIESLLNTSSRGS
ncbi:hypothetical protein [Bartonella sp. CB169]|uniref:hypothetical protein n=1 Tax=Bartonella sp. CB169 TaxID=3112257 RepID=UPI00300E613E